jgi:sugar/nucleoside kinase (ribokinase family)
VLPLRSMAGPSIGRQARPPILIVGAASRDIATDDPRGWRLGGGVTYGAMAAARLGAHVRALVGADDEAARAQELDLLRDAGVEVHIVNLARGPIFDNQPLPDGGRRQVAHQAADKITPSACPREWRTSGAVILAPVAGELGPGWARLFSEDMLIALGWQGLLRRIVAGRPVEPRRMRPLSLIARADLNVVSAEDARLGGAPLERLLRREGQQLVITNGPRTAMHVIRRDGRLAFRTLPVRPATHIRDETGAGDVFLAGWAAATLAQGAGGQRTSPRALALAVAAASAKVEVGSLVELPDLSQVRDRLLRPPPACRQRS